MDRLIIAKNWANYKPSEIVEMFTEKYSNVASRSSLLSVFKSNLKKSSNPPPKEYLDSLTLGPSVYNKLNKNYAKKLHTEGYNVKYFADINESVVTAIKSLDSERVCDLWPAAALLSGFRPIEILTAEFTLPIYNSDTLHREYYINAANLAKKRGMESDVVRLHPLLCPAGVWLNIVEKIRKELPLGDSNIKTMQKHGYKILKWNRALFPHIPKVTNTLLRRIYASLAYYTYRGDFQGNVDRLTYVSDVLGHSSISSSVVYNLVEFDKTNLVNVFEYFHFLKENKK